MTPRFLGAPILSTLTLIPKRHRVALGRVNVERVDIEAHSQMIRRRLHLKGRWRVGLKNTSASHYTVVHHVNSDQSLDAPKVASNVLFTFELS